MTTISYIYIHVLTLQRISGLGHSTSESQGSDLELATLIREHGADLECKNSRGQTPLDLTDDENFKKSILAVKKT